MATANEKIRANIELIKNKNSKYYDRVNELIEENNNNFKMEIISRLGNDNVKYNKVDVDKIEANSNEIKKILLSIKGNLVEMSMLVKQLEPLDLSAQEITDLLAEIDVAKNTPAEGGDI